jgi:hypothetical protein
MTAKEHNRLVGIFLMAHGGMQAVIMVLLCVFYAIMGTAMFATAPGDQKFVGLVFVGLIVFVAILALLFVLPQVIGGYKIYRELPNARTWGIVGSIISCLSFPIGTAVGVYGLWFLFGEEGTRFYLGGQTQNAFPGPPQPPPPNSSQ